MKRKIRRIVVLAIVASLAYLGSHPAVIKKYTTPASAQPSQSVTEQGAGSSAEAATTEITASETVSTDPASGTEIYVTYIDVGQGDSILIQDNGQNMLIDTGYYTAEQQLTDTLDAKGVKTVDVLVLTHPDADHIGSAADIISYYDTAHVYMSEIGSDSKTYGYLENAVKETGVEVSNPHAGDKIDFGTAEYDVVGPVSGVCDGYEDTNSHSIIVKMVNGQDKFLFTGDATGEETEDAIAAGYDMSADVLKAAHHGSANCGCNERSFLEAVNPVCAIISCGANNRYGHPHVETMQFIQDMGIKMFRTDMQGNISCTSTGNGITFDKEPCTDYRKSAAIPN